MGVNFREMSKFGYFRKLENNTKDSFKKLNICNRIIKFEVENFACLCSNSRIN